MRKHKLFIIAACITLASASCFTACSGSNSAADSEAAVASAEGSTEKSTEESAGDSMGMISEIDTDNKTVSIATMSFASMPNFSMPNTSNNDGQAPEMPSGDSSNQDGQQPPEMPSGDFPSQDGQQPPEMPSGDFPSQDGQQPEMPEGNPMGEATTFSVTDTTIITDEEGNEISLSDLEVNSFVSYTVDSDNASLLTISLQSMDAMPGGGMGGGSNGQAPSEYTTVLHYQEDASEESVSQESTGTDENIAWISDGATVELTDVTANKESSDSTGGDQSSFYGVGAAYLVTDGTLNISDSTITTDSAGGAGVFAYGSGVANVSDCTITTEQGTSGGIHVAGGGTLNASNLTVETNGASSAAIRSDRGSGTMTVNGGTYTSNGTGSPAVYSTADITVSNADLTATNSEAVCIEGKNSLTLKDCILSSNMPDSEQNDCKWSVILYQSMSGDSEEGTSVFSMTRGSLTSNSGGLFYTTNTSSEFTLESVDISTTDTPEFFLKCTGNSNQRGWGQAGANGANCTFTAIDQEMNGDIIWDSISTLKLDLTEGSVLTGAIVDDESNAGDGGDGSATVSIDKNSTWIVTGDSTVSNLKNDGTIEDEDGHTVSIVGTDGTEYVSGSSTYKVTVETYK